MTRKTAVSSLPTPGRACEMSGWHVHARVLMGTAIEQHLFVKNGPVSPEAWLAKMDTHKAEIMPQFRETYGEQESVKWWNCRRSICLISWQE